MAIFIGRNIEEESKDWLKLNRVDYLEKALIYIQLNDPDYSFFEKIAGQQKQWIVTSKWAAKWLSLNQSSIGFTSDDSVFCLSKKQANIISEFSDLVFVSSEKNSSSLSEMLHNREGLKIFLKGNLSLKVLGAKIVEVEVYQNNLTKPAVENEFDAYLFFSPSGIESFIQGGNTLPEYSTIITIGETTAEKARGQFANPVIVSPQQGELEMIQFALL